MTEDRWKEPAAGQESASDADRASSDRAVPSTDATLWEVMERTLLSATLEQRRSRRWGIFFKCLTAAYVIGLTLALWAPGAMDMEPVVDGRHTAVVPVEGVIASGEPASADALIQSLTRAFTEPTAVAVMLEINSPGGSPVQAEYVYEAIVDLKRQYPNKAVHAVIGDIGASGAYYIAAAADYIHASPASIVGSIGVVAGGFGFVELLEKIGVERRVMTAGENKAMLDPFSEESPEQRAQLQAILDATHARFIATVEAGRRGRLRGDPAELFDGRIFHGEAALQRGLIDSLASPDTVARDIIGAPLRIPYQDQAPWFERLSRAFGVGVGASLSAHFGYGIGNPNPLSQ